MQTLGIAEIQGLFGPVTISERVLQRIWLSGDFDSRSLRLIDGTPIQILSRGVWNHAEGPDFLDAEIEILGQILSGDIELHLYERDWFNHNHHKDKNFENVILHVVLFRGVAQEIRPARTCSGRTTMTLGLLPFLDKDLEAYASDQALESLNANSHRQFAQWLLAMDRPNRIRHIFTTAKTRWTQKLAFAHQRLKQMSFAEAGHLTLLEILGYSRNRSVMGNLATRFTPNDFRTLPADAIFEAGEPHWRLAGVRPANHPLARIRQYQTLLHQVPHWAELVEAWGKRLPFIQVDNSSSREIRREFSFTAAREFLAREVLCETIGGSRFDTIVVDGLLPLLATHFGRNYFAWWLHWPAGDTPDAYKTFLKDIEVISLKQPYCNGLFQGTLQLLIQAS